MQFMVLKLQLVDGKQTSGRGKMNSFEKKKMDKRQKLALVFIDVVFRFLSQWHSGKSLQYYTLLKLFELPIRHLILQILLCLLCRATGSRTSKVVRAT
jgi:hypothetical protein